MRAAWHEIRNTEQNDIHKLRTQTGNQVIGSLVEMCRRSKDQVNQTEPEAKGGQGLGGNRINLTGACPAGNPHDRVYKDQGALCGDRSHEYTHGLAIFETEISGLRCSNSGGG